MSKTICILGGGGSFAIHTAFALLNRYPDGTRVIGVGRNPLRPEPFSLGIERQERFHYHVRHTTYELDLLMELLDKEQPDTIVNFAAQGEGAVSWEHSWRFFETNSMGLARLVEELYRRLDSVEHGYLKHFIQIGTSELYGSVDHPVTELAPLRPSSPYAISKAAFDQYLLSMWTVKGFPATVLRPSNAYGPGQLLHRVIPRAILSGVLGQKFPLQGGGRARKSYIFVTDLADAIGRVIDKGAATFGEVYNLGPEKPTSIRKVVELCAEAVGVPFEELVTEVPGRPGEDACYWLSSDKAKYHLDWEPTVGWHHGLHAMVVWAREHQHFLSKVDPTYVLRG